VVNVFINILSFLDGWAQISKLFNCRYNHTSMVTSSLVPPFSLTKYHFRYGIFDLLNLKSLASRLSHHYSNLLLTLSLVLSIRIMSSLNNMHCGTSSSIPLLNSSITLVKKEELSINQWRRPKVLKKWYKWAPHFRTKTLQRHHCENQFANKQSYK